MDEKIITREVDYMKLLFDNKNISVYELDALYLGSNPNQMYLDKECVLKSLPSFADMPLYCIIDNRWNPLDSAHNDFLEHFREDMPDRITRDRILPFGCIPESAIKDARFVERDGKTYLRINVVVWKSLLPHVSDILQRRDGNVKISIEFYIKEAIQDEETGILKVERFELGAVTALGENFKEIMEGSKLKSVKFSYKDYVKETKSEYFSFAEQEHVEIPENVLGIMKNGVAMREKYGRGGTKSIYNSVSTISEIGIMYESQIKDAEQYFASIKETPTKANPPTGKYILYNMFGGSDGSDWINLVCNSKSGMINKYAKEGGNLVDKIEIDNKKESAVDSGSWENPGKNLYDPLIGADNVEALVKEAYLVVEEGYKDAPSEKLKYPHHVVKDGKLVLNVAGVKAAFARASQLGIVEGAVKAHLERHYKELGLSVENFAVKCAEMEEDLVASKTELEEEKERFANITKEYETLQAKYSELETEYVSSRDVFDEVNEKLNSYMRKDEIAENMAMIGEYCGCFEEEDIEELSECAQKMSCAEMKEMMASKVMGFAKGYCMNSLNAEKKDKLAQFSVNPFYVGNPTHQKEDKLNVLSNITKKSKTKVV